MLLARWLWFFGRRPMIHRNPSHTLLEINASQLHPPALDTSQQHPVNVKPLSVSIDPQITHRIGLGDRIVVLGAVPSGQCSICLLYTSPSPRD
eukprot:12571915-Alexandrium_andersonii.AAC.1